jgi:hypothetical protein
MLLKLAITLPVLLALSSAMTLERSGKRCLRDSWESITHVTAAPAPAPAPGEMTILIGTDTSARNIRRKLHKLYFTLGISETVSNHHKSFIVLLSHIRLREGG